MSSVSVCAVCVCVCMAVCILAAACIWHGYTALCSVVAAWRGCVWLFFSTLLCILNVIPCGFTVCDASMCGCISVHALCCVYLARVVILGCSVCMCDDHSRMCVCLQATDVHTYASSPPFFDGYFWLYSDTLCCTGLLYCALQATRRRCFSLLYTLMSCCAVCSSLCVCLCVSINVCTSKVSSILI